jgi:hypothetical protein
MLDPGELSFAGEPAELTLDGAQAQVGQLFGDVSGADAVVAWGGCHGALDGFEDG